jgi:asparagine synthase (glutamine-hydrolysing)
MISDVPLGITLSGGIDTSSMVAMSKELGKSRDIHTFSIKIKEPSFDESEYQKIMAHHAGTIHHQVDIDPDDVLKYMIEHVAYMDEPSGNGANIPSYLLAKDASKYVSVLLSGEGGDEISNAYDTHLAYKIRKMYLKHIPDAMRKALFKIAHSLPASYEKLSFDFLAKRFTEGAEKGIPEAHLYWRHVFTEREKKKLLGSSFQRYMPSEKIFADLFNSLDMDDDLNKISLIDLKYFFICDLMVKNDRTFMAHSVEARFPYVDRKVVEFASSIPPEYRIKGFTARYTEKMAMKKILPRKIFKRKSMGLEMPHSLWFFRGLEKLAGKYFTRKKLEADGFFNYEYVNELWQQHLSRERDNGRALWSILNFLIWMDLFVHSSDYKKYLDPYPADE